MIAFVVCFVIGIYTGYIGELRGWSKTRTCLTAGFLGGVVALLGQEVKASEVDAYKRLSQSAVHISNGSGFIVRAPSGAKYLISNWHVCSSATVHKRLHANYQDGTSVEGPVVKLDPHVDLCAARVSKFHLGLTPAPKLDPKEQVYTRGYPYGILSQTTGQYLGVSEWGYTYSIEEVGECFKGSIKAYDHADRLSGCHITYRVNLTNLYSRPGSSGSPVVNGAGDLVGVMSSWDSVKDEGGMVPLDQIKEFLGDL